MTFKKYIFFKPSRSLSLSYDTPSRNKMLQGNEKQPWKQTGQCGKESEHLNTTNNDVSVDSWAIVCDKTFQITNLQWLVSLDQWGLWDVQG